MSQWAAVLAGGSGTRFWPLSTAAHPKQFLPLTGSEPLLAQAVRRLDGLIPSERIVVVTARNLVEATRALVPTIPPTNVLGEPRAASTAPALAWATQRTFSGSRVPPPPLRRSRGPPRGRTLRIPRP